VSKDLCTAVVRRPMISSYAAGETPELWVVLLLAVYGARFADLADELCAASGSAAMALRHTSLRCTGQ